MLLLYKLYIVASSQTGARLKCTLWN